MDVIYGTVATAIIGGLLIVAFLVGPRLIAGSLADESYPDMSNTHLLRTQKAERAILETIHRRRHRYAELQAFASGGALVLAGWILAAVYCLAAHQIPV